MVRDCIIVKILDTSNFRATFTVMVTIEENMFNKAETLPG